jgi:hypothetical protein
MDKKAKTTDPALLLRPAAVRFIPDGATYIGVPSRSTAWKVAKTDPEFKATVTLFKIGAATMALTEELDRFLALKKAKCAALQVERMARVRAHRAKHGGEFDAEIAQKKMPA